jgi:hypothetical protein
MWVTRIARLLPEMIGLWNAIDDKDEERTLDALLALRRKVSDAQMHETLDRG